MTELNETLLRLPEVVRISGVRRSQIYALVKQKRFPSPIKLSERCSAFLESEVRVWIAERILQSRGTLAADLALLPEATCVPDDDARQVRPRVQP
jgi:prophage regulatory protein